MGKRLGLFLGLAVLSAVAGAGLGCSKSKSNDAVSEGLGHSGGSPPGMGFGGSAGPRGPIREAMTKLFKGPQSLKDSIGRELNSASPAWETVQSQAKEFARLAASLSQYSPPKGDKDSWMKLTDAFAKSAATLDRAVEAKNKEEARAAHAVLSDSQTCRACHQAHRGGPGGMGAPGQFSPPGKN